jgi:hypothetical protein
MYVMFNLFKRSLLPCDGLTLLTLGVCFGFVGVTPAHAEKTRFYNLEGFATWLDGNPEGTAVTEAGDVVLPSHIRERYQNTEHSFSAAAAWGEEIALARIADAQVILVDRAGKEKELYRPELGNITSMVAHKKYLYVALAPGAKIIRVDKKGVSKEIYNPDADYIWDMLHHDGDIFGVTGEPATVFKVGTSGKNAEILFEPEQLHLRSIAYEPKLGIFVGGGEHGILYHAPAKNLQKFRALFDSGHTEITSIALLGEHAYIAAVSGAQALVDKVGHNQGAPQNPSVEVRSQLAKVALNGASEVLAGSNDEAIFDLIVDDKKSILVATGATGRDDPRGRLYSVEPEKRLISLVYQSPSRRLTHLLSLRRGAIGVVAGAGGRIVHLAGGHAKSGEFFTAPFDTTMHSTFGMLQIFSKMPEGTQVLGAVRTGQTKSPDATWSSWSKDVAAPALVAPGAPSGRYLQVRLTLKGNGRVSPAVSRLRLAYLRQNMRPFIREVETLDKGVALFATAPPNAKSKINKKGDVGNGAARKDLGKTLKSLRPRRGMQDGALSIKWTAEDPNGDTLSYDLMVRGVQEDKWQVLDHKMDTPFYTLQSSQLPDGHYHFKVLATDAPSNPAGKEKSDTRESAAILIDNSPPTLSDIKLTFDDDHAYIAFDVDDKVGPLMEALYALDAQEFRPLAPLDGVLDGPAEKFNSDLGVLKPGFHRLTVRVTDEGGNTGFGFLRFEAED